MTRSIMTDAVNRGAKTSLEVTGRVKVPVETLFRVHKKCKEYKISLKLCNIAPEIRQVFKITGIDKILDLHDDAAQAMEGFQKSGSLFFRKQKPTSYEVS
jgi:hypothetical protein